MLRVRQLIEPLVPQTERLLQNGLLPPNIQILFDSNKTVRYPPFVYNLQKKYKWIFSHFGLFLEHLLREIVRGEWKSKIYDLYITITKEYTKEDMGKVVSKEDLYGCMGRFVNISKYMNEDFENVHFMFDEEFKHKVIVGHPDLVTKDVTAVYDVKTCTKFNSPTMKNGAILQVSAYLALARAAGYNPKKIGVVLPFQQETLEYNLRCSSYDHIPFLNFLLELSRPRLYTLQEHVELTNYLPIIGAHTLKIGGSVHKSLLYFYQQGIFSRPCQIFMRGNRGAASIKLADDDIAESLSFIYTHNIKYFVHASYAINLCHPCGIKTKETNPDPWATRILREDLQLTSVTGGRGVVVHTGKAMHLTEEEGYNEMYKSVVSVLDAATEDCPLLIETPVDKGTELCGTPQSLAHFYLRFTTEQRKRLKICVDTCHVFAAGWFPYDYLVKFAELAGRESIALIHLNDAQWLKGSCHDGHAWVGRGCIGMSEMLKAIRWCAEADIPMVHE